MTAALMEQGTEWARRQEYVNGRFAEIDRSSGEVLSEHGRHTPFLRDWSQDRPEAAKVQRASSRARDTRIECIGGKWYEIDNPTGEIRRRLYTQAERDLAIRLCGQDRSPARVARFMDIPVDTLRSWMRRGACSWSASGNVAAA